MEDELKVIGIETIYHYCRDHSVQILMLSLFYASTAEDIMILQTYKFYLPAWAPWESAQLLDVQQL
jgi:hypothetical protein